MRSPILQKVLSAIWFGYVKWVFTGSSTSTMHGSVVRSATICHLNPRDVYVGIFQCISMVRHWKIFSIQCELKWLQFFFPLTNDMIYEKKKNNTIVNETLTALRVSVFFSATSLLLHGAYRRSTSMRRGVKMFFRYRHKSELRFALQATASDDVCRGKRKEKERKKERRRCLTTT